MRLQEDSQRLALLGKSSIDVGSCDGCQDLISRTPIFFSLLAEAFGITDETAEQDLLIRYHLNGHSTFTRTAKPKQLEPNRRLLGLME